MVAADAYPAPSKRPALITITEVLMGILRSVVKTLLDFAQQNPP
jgi:hypothetical protein